MNKKIEQLLEKHKLPTDSLTDPLMTLDMEKLGNDIASFKEEGLSQGFIRRRIVFFMDGYRYSLRAAQKRWGIDFGFYETGKEPVKKVYFSGKFNDNAGRVWLQRMNEDKEFGNNLVQELKTIIEMEKYLATTVSQTELSKAEIKKYLENHLSWWIQFFEFAFLWFCAENIQEDTNEQIRKVWKSTPESLKEFLDGVYRPMNLPMSSVEQRDILKISQLKGGELEQALDIHWKKYKHLALHNIDDDPFDKEYYISRVKSLQKEGEYEKQKDLLTHADEEINEANNLLNKVEIPNELKNRIEFVRWFMFLRTESVDNMMLVNASYRRVFDSLSKLFELPIEAVLNMMYKEIFESIEAGKLTVSKETVLDRLQNGYAYFIGYRTEALLTGDDRQKLIDVLHPATNEEVVKEIKGQIAYKGKVKAVARVILDRKNASELKEGEILVTAMTSPDFVPAMKISAGIITNEGGVLCHAAIMSRELRKPCVIGTKIATDAIKTGQMLTLDADNGIITLE
jgi:phosphoenolpyruvate synthase/pyruvate phosphate dikinase